MSASKDYYRLAEQKRTKAMCPDEAGDNVAIIVLCSVIGLLLWIFDVVMWTP